MSSLTLDGVALDCPDAAVLAAFYADLLGTEIEFDRILANDGTVALWFQEVEHYLPSTWPTQGRGQMIHLDLAVPDVDAAIAVVTAFGGRVAEPREGYHAPIVIDPAGHPICLFPIDGSTAVVSGLTIDTNDVPTLSQFWHDLIGGELTQHVGWTSIDRSPAPSLYFQHVADYQPPTWPTQERGQQVHFDTHTTDREAQVSRAVALGATLRQVDDGFTVLLDPSGHPFCICDDDNR